MVFHKQVAEIIPGAMSLALVGKSMKVVDDSLKEKEKKDNLMKGSIDILVGVPLIGAVAGSVAKL